MSADTGHADAHNHAVRVLLPQLGYLGTDETQQWIILESLMIGIGLFHGRTRREIGEVLELMADRIVTGERGIG